MNMLQKIRRAVHETDKAPRGFKLAADWQKEWGLGRAQTTLLLRSGLVTGVLKRLNLRTESGQVYRRLPFYGPAK